MGFGTSIEWAHHSFNPWIGCQRVSPGCVNCYAETWDNRYREGRNWGVRGTRERTADANWKKPLVWNAQAAAVGERWRVFPSMCDPFEDRDELLTIRAEFFALIEATSSLDWLLLTKRPENVLAMVPSAWEDRWPENVWIGTSVEDQRRADERIPHLLKVPAPVLFLSCEPLLGPVDLAKVGNEDLGWFDPLNGWELDGGVAAMRPAGMISWVIVGGESGHGARPMHPEWARQIRDVCAATGVAFLFKQWGEFGPEPRCSNCTCVPGETCCTGRGLVVERNEIMRRLGKHASARRLDGFEYTEFPAVQVAR